MSRVTLLVLGAPASQVERIRRAAASHGVRVTTDASRADWVLAASNAERQRAMDRLGLPSYRVVEVAGLGAAAPLGASVLAAGLERMCDLGPYRRTVSRSGVAVLRACRWLVAALLERTLGPYVVDAARQRAIAADKAARLATQAVLASREEAHDPERIARKAARKAARRVERRTAVAHRSTGG